ncbi:MAG TPA: ATP-binding protein [Polyangiaceae bacterium]|nr:ATP-binding protein [Polyangiaceae bacterium]
MTGVPLPDPVVFAPYGDCHSWSPSLVELYVVSDAIAAASFVAIPLALFYFARRRRDLPFGWMFWCFGVFVLACGAVCSTDVWAFWRPDYWVVGVVRALRAATALPTAILLIRLVPQALSIPEQGALRSTNERLRRTTGALRKNKAVLELKIEERTAELKKTNEELRQQIADRRQAEEALRVSENKLRQAHKMEAVGRLAGGVAHDFNNLLSVVLSYSSMLLEGLAPDDPMRPELTQIEDAGQRAAALTQQLLAFSRQQVLQPRPVALNEIVARAEKLLGRLIGEHISLVTSLDAKLGLVNVDAGQIEQVVVNLVVNARDAMPKGGRIVVSTRSAPAEGDEGPQALLTVADDGVGMDAATLEKIYEPFFTTKGVGEGTGLGLATVLGIVQQSGGRIDVESAVGEGTTFFVRLPMMPGREAGDEPAAPKSVAPPGNETILVVEDEEVVRDLVVEILRRHGYRLLSASSGEEALGICRDPEYPIDLVVTDVVMPVMGGQDLARTIAAQYPAIRVLMMSGYPNDVLDMNEGLDPDTDFLRKPIQPRELTRRVREVLNADR